MPSPNVPDDDPKQRKKPTKSREIDWDAIQGLYEANQISVAKIARRFDVSSHTIYRRARSENWAMRQPQRSRRQVAPPLTITQGTTTHTMKAALAARLCHSLEERIMAEEEDAMAHDTGNTERDAKAITAMAKALEVLGQMLDAEDTSAAMVAKPETPDDDQEIDIDAFRERLIERIERLRDDGPST